MENLSNTIEDSNTTFRLGLFVDPVNTGHGTFHFGTLGIKMLFKFMYIFVNVISSRNVDRNL